MKQTMKRPVAWLLSLVMIASLLVAIPVPAQAATVTYVKSEDGKYIYNWGTRGTVADDLSPNAEKFYADNSFSYKDVAALAGSNDTSSVPSSELYKKLQSLMKSNHSYIIGYQDTRWLYMYTDCQNSGTDTKAISSFYSGKEIGPDWDGGATWNREHTWPKSKGQGPDKQGEKADIMMLRPTANSENGSRGNIAYGESAGYFKPNVASAGAHDVRGDVARIMLYTYVRWGNTSNMWGSNGVIESKEVLIKWMTEDPVDTWELGRNDSVEAITGTRNVFVDYPELAFELFEETVPANYASPSSAGKTYGTVANGTSGGGTTGDSSTGGTTTDTNTNQNTNTNQDTNTNTNTNTNQNTSSNQGTSNNQNTTNKEPVVDNSTVDTPTSEENTQETEAPSNTEEKNDDTTSTESKNDVENESDSSEEQSEEKGGFPMEAIFVVMLIVGVAGLAALIISDRKEKNNTKEEE